MSKSKNKPKPNITMGGEVINVNTEETTETIENVDEVDTAEVSEETSETVETAPEVSEETSTTNAPEETSETVETAPEVSEETSTTNAPEEANDNDGFVDITGDVIPAAEEINVITMLSHFKKPMTNNFTPEVLKEMKLSLLRTSWKIKPDVIENYRGQIIPGFAFDNTYKILSLDHKYLTIVADNGNYTDIMSYDSLESV